MLKSYYCEFHFLTGWTILRPDDPISLAIIPKQNKIYKNPQSCHKWNIENFRKEKHEENALINGVDYFFDFEKVQKFLRKKNNEVVKDNGVVEGSNCVIISNIISNINPNSNPNRAHTDLNSNLNNNLDSNLCSNSNVNSDLNPNSNLSLTLNLNLNLPSNNDLVFTSSTDLNLNSSPSSNSDLNNLTTENHGFDAPYNSLKKSGSKGSNFINNIIIVNDDIHGNNFDIADYLSPEKENINGNEKDHEKEDEKEKENGSYDSNKMNKIGKINEINTTNGINKFKEIERIYISEGDGGEMQNTRNDNNINVNDGNNDYNNDDNIDHNCDIHNDDGNSNSNNNGSNSGISTSAINHSHPTPTPAPILLPPTNRTHTHTDVLRSSPPSRQARRCVRTSRLYVCVL